MSFRFEKDMTEIVVSWMESQGLMVKREFGYPWGICDLVGVSINKSRAMQRKKYSQLKPIGSVSRVLLLDKIPEEYENRSITIKGLVREFYPYYTKEEIEYDLEKLIQYKFIHSPKRNHFQKKNGWMPLHDRIVTIELKLNRIQEVLYQASLHRRVATESYIAIPMHKASYIFNTGKNSVFKDTGVGILGVSNSDCRLLIPSNLSNIVCDKILQLHYIERFWNKFLETI